MSESLGGVKYEIDLDTSEILKAKAVANKASSSMVSDFNKADKAVKNFNTQTTKTAQSVKRGLTPNIGQAGIQVQQFVGQLQGGQSAMLALSQQSADLGIVLGAPLAGVLFSLGAVLAGVLLPAIMDTKTSIEKLDTAIGHAKAIMSVGAGGIVEYTEKMQELGRVSQMVAEFQIATAMKKAKEGVKSAVKSMADELSKVDDTIFGTQFGFAVENSAILATNSMRNYTVTVGNLLGEVGSASDRSGDKAQEMGAKFIKLFAELSKAKTPKAVTDIQEEIIKMATATGKADKKFLEMIESLMVAGEGTEDYFAKLRTLAALLEEGSKGTTDFTNKTNKLTSSFSENIKQLSIQNVLLKEGERAAYRASLSAEGYTEEMIEAQLALYDANQALIKNKEDTDAATKANKEYEESVRKKTESDLAWFEQQEKWLADKNKKETESNITFAQGIINKGKSPEELMAEQYARLDQLRKTDVENAQLYQDAMTALEQQAMESREALWSESYQRIGQQAADSMADYLTGVETAEDATRMLASTIVSEVIQSLVKMGISAVTQSLTTTAAATTGIATTTGAAVASTGVMAAAQGTAMATVGGAVSAIAGGLATAWAPAAAFASLATLGANSAPAIAGIYATMGATLGAQLVGGIVSNGITAATGFDGTSRGRQYGGPVSKGMYRVNETGVPEVYSQGGKDYLMNTKNANITPLDKTQGGGGGMTVNVSNNTPYEVYVTQDQAANIANVQIGKEAKKASQGRGNIFKGLSSSTNVKNKANRG